jgi:hypothetical protein
MSRSFLTNLNLNKNQLLNAAIQNLASAPSSPVTGQIYYKTGDQTLNYWDGSAWVTLAQGGDVTTIIQAAIDALTTDDIEQGTSNKYYSDTLVDDHLSGTGGVSYSGGSISVDRGTVDSWYDASGAASTAQSNAEGYTDSAISGLSSVYDPIGAASTAQSNAEGYTDSAISGLSSVYDAIGAASTAQSNAEDYTDSAISGLSTVYDAYGAASSVASDLSTHEGLSSGVHGVTGTVVGDSDTQTLTNKTLGSGTAFGADLDASGYTITDLATPLNPSDAATKGYVDSTAQGLSVLGSVRTASDANIDISSAAPEVGSVTLNNGDRVLLKAQDTATENGIYIYNSGTGLLVASTVPADTDLKEGSYVLVEEGLYAAQGWIVTAFSAGASTWTQFSAAGEYTAGNGIDITSGVISAVVQGTQGLQLTSSGIGVNIGGGLYADPGTGALSVSVGTGLTINGSNQIVPASGYGIQKYSANNGALTASGGQVTWTVTHNIGTKDVTVQVRDNGTDAQVEVDVVHTSTTAVTLSWVSGDVSANAYRVVVVG